MTARPDRPQPNAAPLTSDAPAAPDRPGLHGLVDVLVDVLVGAQLAVVPVVL